MPKVLVPLAQGCEELEAVTVIDLLRRAKVDVITAGLDDRIVVASRGTRLVPDMSLDEALEINFDMVVLPGGQPGADNLERDHRIEKLLKKTVDRNGFAAAICAAPKVLAQAGLLQGRRATAFPGTLEALDLGDTSLSAEPVVVDGKVVTSRGPGTAMDFALVLIEKLCGTETRRQVEAGLQRD